MPACRDRLARDESVRLADKDAYLPNGKIVGDLACAAMHKAKRAPRFPTEPSGGLTPKLLLLRRYAGKREWAGCRLHEVLVVVAVIERGFQALLVCTELIAAGRVSVGT
jgi:hypothetical protein